jgi:hypothetical protein
MRRIPVWVAVLPLALGVIAYWLWWERQAEAFRQQVAAFAPGATIGGFPYRIEAGIGARRIVRGGGGVTLAVAASRATVNRQPWRTGHVVIAAENPSLALAVSALPAVRFRVAGPAALASVRRPGNVLERLSIRFERAEVDLPFAGPFAASAFELHLRETPVVDASAQPTGPTQAEARIAGTLARGDVRVAVDLPLFATADAPIVSVAKWRDGGTVEIRGGRLSTAEGEAVAGFDATLAPLPDGRVAVAGTIDTDCPQTLRALLAGRTAAPEYRARRTQRLPVNGIDGAIELGEPQGPSGGPVRSQEPPCPALRR